MRVEASSLMASIEARLARLEGLANAFQGLPANATVSLPHNDSWLFEDNVDGPGGFAGNLRYVIADNTQKIVSARLSIHLAPYRTYNSLTLSSTGTQSAAHTHNFTPSVTTGNVALTHTLRNDNTGIWSLDDGASRFVGTTNFDAGTTGTQNANHTHTVSGSSTLGVTEGAVATGVTISFDGLDQTTALGGPFNADVIELNVRPYIGTTQGVWHTIAMTPSGLGRIEAHLRLGVYVSAGQLV